jgi:hypothetical protein
MTTIASYLLYLSEEDFILIIITITIIITIITIMHKNNENNKIAAMCKNNMP